MIAVNGRIVAQGSQFSLNDVEVVSATIDIEDVRAHRAVISRNMQAASSESYHRIEVPFALSAGKFEAFPDEELNTVSRERRQDIKYHTAEEEIAYVILWISLKSHNPLPQARSRMLALGLPSKIKNTRVFCPS